ncbi:baseplate J/gp47 family protein [Actinomycetospora lutea]|uniref:baseplate J/gp47 family protein n=1 Tax=Actinomycetospora lutea TaxID=663604 RepID=UPI0023665BA7|nr:baseplate J/gp47 family protein [Actinomycetospora lutea]MDD7942412.1 baseplate J/gp47 family protein [Actinomycetospora lutea]
MNDDSPCRCPGRHSCGYAETVPATGPGDPERFRHSALLDRMLDRIAGATASGQRALAGLGTRAEDDPAIAVLSAAAGTAHVLAWTLNRLWLDGTLPATQDRSALVALTALLGHEPRPAISATTVVSFTLDPPGAPATGTVPRGTKVASVPVEPDEQPQTFETDDEIEVRGAWSAARPLRRPAPQQITTTTARVTVAEVSTPARSGDLVLVWSARQDAGVAWVLARVVAVTVTPAGPRGEPQTTVLDLAGQVRVVADGDRTDPAGEGTVILLGGRAQPFGATAPDLAFMPQEVRDAQRPRALRRQPTQWRDFVLDADPTPPVSVHLGAVHPEAAPGRVAVLRAPEHDPLIARIGSAADVARAAFGLSLTCTLVTFDEIDDEAFTAYNLLVRETSIALETARLSLVVPRDDPQLPTEAEPDRIVVEGDVTLPVGRRVVLTDADPHDPEPHVHAVTTETARVVTATARDGHTTLVFDAPIARRWPASRLTILGNSVSASHGESPSAIVVAPGSAPGYETLGSADAAAALPRYPLPRTPLTNVPAPGPKGYAPALDVRVAGRAYELADSLYGEGPDSHRYRVRTLGDGRSEVQFGGRLPTGAGTVTARYRTGGGAAGLLGPGRLNQILTPVLGVRSVVNPVPTEGGSDAETTDAIRGAAPKAIRTLDRAVAVADFEAFAQGYRGVGKAAAVELRSGMRRVIVVTVATTTLTTPDPGSDLLTGLPAALLAAAAPGTHVVVTGFTDLAMALRVALATDPALRRADVEQAVREALEFDLGPAARPFATAVHRSQVLASVQRVPGVVAARLTGFSAAGVVEDAEGRLPCPGPSLTATGVAPAALLSVRSADVEFQEFPT